MSKRIPAFFNVSIAPCGGLPVDSTATITFKPSPFVHSKSHRSLPSRAVVAVSIVRLLSPDQPIRGSEALLLWENELLNIGQNSLQCWEIMHMGPRKYQLFDRECAILVKLRFVPEGIPMYAISV